MASTASFHTCDDPKDIFLEKDKVNALRTELENYLKCVKGNYDRLLALTSISSIDAYGLNQKCCDRIPNWRIKDKDGKCVGGVSVETSREIILRILNGQKVNGKDGEWSCGFLGSRWCDLDASKWGIDYVRCAFYSKKSCKGGWTLDKPFAIQIICEKAKA